MNPPMKSGFDKGSMKTWKMLGFTLSSSKSMSQICFNL